MCLVEGSKPAHSPFRTPESTAQYMLRSTLYHRIRGGVSLCKQVQHNQPRNMSKRPASAMAESEDWKQKPPYVRPKDAQEPWKPKYKGQCFCGKVKFEVSEDPVDAKICHCTTCQRLHGAPMQAAAIFEKHHVLFSPGAADHLYFYNSGKKTVGHDLPAKMSCVECRSPIADEGRNMVIFYPATFHFERPKFPEAFQPSCHIFYGQRTVDVKDGKPKFEGHKDDSPKVEE
ncbi:hypothetical protein WJX72_005152 [[Myrmecia] bisecta]|uniref:CENP-V/GFA domain-containing protein n=1 Tax=[Myrmecia] bisecta TaxID=41462 RepID=A0AAW1R707_9CHLO